MERIEIRMTVTVTTRTNREELYERIARCLSAITNEHREDDGIVKVLNVGMVPDSIPVKLKQTAIHLT